jgi:hypothetical protein
VELVSDSAIPPEDALSWRSSGKAMPMPRSGPGAVLALVLFGCNVDEPVEPVPLARVEQHASFAGDGRPPFWSRWTTDGAAGIELPDGFLARGLRCRGRYCDDVGLFAVPAGASTTSASSWTDGFSEEDTNYRVCDGNGFVTGLRCSGKYCDNLQLRCASLANKPQRTGCYWTASVSEEDGGRFVAPEPTYVAGVSCNGRYCDNLNLYVCRADGADPGFDEAKLAATFAPRLRFDQETTTGSGAGSKCFPGDAGAYYAARAQGASPISLCNKDYASLANHDVPAYYVASRLGDRAVLIRYWYFYAWQSTCFLSFGEHAADWESMAVLVVDGQLARVAWYQHGGWYSHEPGGYQLVDGTHPVGYVGKNAHGTYHDDGGSGGCLYFEDYRNPGGNDYHMDTWFNLVALRRGGGQPEWMNCSGDGCFDGVGHPLEQTGDPRSMGGCGKDGCDRSTVANRPFIDDVTGAEFVTLTAQHSGRAVDVPGANGGNGVGLTQYSNWHVDNQRWALEETDSGYYAVSARHSGKCMDVPGGTTSQGANVTQYSCNGGGNQQVRLVGDGGADGAFALQLRHSGQCLDVAGWGMGDGAPLIQWPCTGGANQRFAFAP